MIVRKNDSQIFKIFIASSYKVMFIMAIICIIVSLSYYTMIFSGVYTADTFDADAFVDDLMSGVLEDSEIYNHNPFLENLPVLKLTIPFIRYIYSVIKGNSDYILPSLSNEGIISLLILSFSNSIILLPPLRLFDSAICSCNDKFMLRRNPIVTVTDLFFRLFFVAMCVLSSTMLSVSIASMVSVFPYMQKILIIVVLMIFVCFISSLLHKKLYLSKGKQWLRYFFLEFSKNVFVDLLITILSLFLIGIIFMLNAYQGFIPPEDTLTLFICLIVDITLLVYSVRLFLRN